MSVNYAAGLSEYANKGKCGQPEILDDAMILPEKYDQLADWFKNSKRIVVITGAGVSTAAGIPDFRGPKGVWTLEKKKQRCDVDVTFDTAVPTFTHLALVELEKRGFIMGLISQNIDGLHLRSGFPRNKFAELHGNMFMEYCDLCGTQYIKSAPVKTMALRPTGSVCTMKKLRGKCRGKLRDTILDWEDPLPDKDLDLAEAMTSSADLCLCIGTSLQINPCGELPLATMDNSGNIAVINLQKTKIDDVVQLRIGARADDVMRALCRRLEVTVPEWTRPIVRLRSSNAVEAKLDLYKDTLVIVDEELLPDTAYDVIAIDDDVKVKVEDNKSDLKKQECNECLSIKDFSAEPTAKAPKLELV